MLKRRVPLRAWAGVVALALACGCASTKIIESGVEPSHRPRGYGKVLLVAVAARPEVRKSFEAQLARHLAERGITDVGFGEVLFGEDPRDLEPGEIRRMVVDGGYDGVVSMAMLRRELAASTSSANYRYLNYQGFATYYPGLSGRVVTASGGQEKTTFILQAKFYDVPSGEAVWSAVTKSVNPKKLSDFASAYANVIAKRLEDDRVIIVE